MRRPTGKLLTCLNRDDWMCQLCFQPISTSMVENSNSSLGGPSVDHIIPESWGASGSLWNLRSAHSGCNVRRGNKVDLERDRPALAKNLHIMMGGTEEDREAAAGQLFAAYQQYYEVKNNAKNGSSIDMDNIPPIVRMIKSGRFPWG
ncbi:hypothetical protein [Nocardia phage P3.1]|nr:hypothetical protein [Nocardia phage P3.1]